MLCFSSCFSDEEESFLDWSLSDVVHRDVGVSEQFLDTRFGWVRFSSHFRSAEGSF